MAAVFQYNESTSTLYFIDFYSFSFGVKLRFRNHSYL